MLVQIQKYAGALTGAHTHNDHHVCAPLVGIQVSCTKRLTGILSRHAALKRLVTQPQFVGYNQRLAEAGERVFGPVQVSDIALATPENTRWRHSLAAAGIARCVGEQLGLSEDHLALLEIAGLLHDVALPSGGDTVKNGLKYLGLDDLDEDAGFETWTRSMPGKRLLRSLANELGCGAEDLAQKLVQVISPEATNLLHEILNVADTASYLSNDLWLMRQARMITERDYNRVAPLYESIMAAQLHENVFVRCEEHLVWRNTQALRDFLVLRAHMWNAYREWSSEFTANALKYVLLPDVLGSSDAGTRARALREVHAMARADYNAFREYIIKHYAFDMSAPRVGETLEGAYFTDIEEARAYAQARLTEPDVILVVLAPQAFTVSCKTHKYYVERKGKARMFRDVRPKATAKVRSIIAKLAQPHYAAFVVRGAAKVSELALPQQRAIAAWKNWK